MMQESDKIFRVIRISRSTISDVIRLYDIDNLIHYIKCMLISFGKQRYVAVVSVIHFMRLVFCSKTSKCVLQIRGQLFKINNVVI